MYIYIFNFIYFIFREGAGGEREGEKHQCVVASWVPPTRDLACNPGMCPDWELNQRPFGSQAGAQSLSHTSQGSFYSFLRVSCRYDVGFRNMFSNILFLIKNTICGCLLHVPHQGPGPQPRHVPWLGIEPATLWFTAWCSIHWATPARAGGILIY